MVHTLAAARTEAVEAADWYDSGRPVQETGFSTRSIKLVPVSAGTLGCTDKSRVLHGATTCGK